jgi:catechol 2,3-dioxygenase-like lactoylglutathione lyase family enzyme
MLESSTTTTGLQIVQIGLNTTDMPATLQFYSEIAGFQNAGANAFWGPACAIQGLGPDTRGMMWWLVGQQSFFQLEIFQHTVPQPKLLPADWKPNDHGWVRFGLAVADFENALDTLRRWGIMTITPVQGKAGERRVALRDPQIGVIVELLEGGPEPSRRRVGGSSFIYATCSVGDLEGARIFYRDILGLEIQPRDRLHSAADEKLWGLEGADPGGFLAVAGDMMVEIVSYSDPAGRSQAEDHCSADQGIMNIALGSRDIAAVRDVVARVKRAGIRTGLELGEGDMMALFLLDPDRRVELIALPEALDGAVGFVAGFPFFGTWSAN